MGFGRQDAPCIYSNNMSLVTFDRPCTLDEFAAQHLGNRTFFGEDVSYSGFLDRWNQGMNFGLSLDTILWIFSN